MFDLLMELLGDKTLYVKKTNNDYAIDTDYISEIIPNVLTFMYNDQDVAIAEKMTSRLDTYKARFYKDTEQHRLVLAIYF